MWGEDWQRERNSSIFDDLPNYNYEEPKSWWEQYKQSKNRDPFPTNEFHYIAGGPGDPNNEFPNSYVAKEVTVYGTDPNKGDINYFSGTEEYSHRYFRFSFVEGLAGHATFRVKGYMNIKNYNGTEYLSVYASSWSAANMIGDVYYNGNVSLYDGDLLLGTYPLKSLGGSKIYNTLQGNVLKDVGRTKLIPLPKRGYDNITVKISVGYNISLNKWQGVTSVRKGSSIEEIGVNINNLNLPSSFNFE
jgi:hypothetical protein